MCYSCCLSPIILKYLGPVKLWFRKQDLTHCDAYVLLIFMVNIVGYFKISVNSSTILELLYYLSSCTVTSTLYPQSH